MHRTQTKSHKLVSVIGILRLLVVSILSGPARGQTPAAGTVTVFEGGGLIVGDGRAPIDKVNRAAFQVTQK